MILDWLLNGSKDAMKDGLGKIENLNMYHMSNNSIIAMLYFLKLKIKLWLHKRMPLFFGDNTFKYL